MVYKKIVNTKYRRDEFLTEEEEELKWRNARLEDAYETRRDQEAEYERITITGPWLFIDLLAKVKENVDGRSLLAQSLCIKMAFYSLHSELEPLKKMLKVRKAIASFYRGIELHKVNYKDSFEKIYRRFDRFWRPLEDKHGSTRIYLRCRSHYKQYLGDLAHELGLTLSDLALYGLICTFLRSGKITPENYKSTLVEMKEQIKKIVDNVELDLREHFRRKLPELLANLMIYNVKCPSAPMPQCPIGDPIPHGIHDIIDLLEDYDPTYAREIKQIVQVYDKSVVKEDREASEFDEQAVRALYRFLGHRLYTEIRGIDPNDNRHPIAIFVTNEDDFAKNCRRLDGRYQVYVGINERFRESGKLEDIARINAIVIDIDAIRPPGMPASQGELEEAKRVAERILFDLKREGIEAYLSMSGNGYHIWIAIPPIELNAENRELWNWRMQEFQRVVITKYHHPRDRPTCQHLESWEICPTCKVASVCQECGDNKPYNVRIDNVGNLDRIIKVPGTKSIKGITSDARPHRYATWQVDPREIERVENSKLLEVLNSLKLEEPPYPRREASGEGFIEIDIRDVVGLSGLKRRGDEYYGSHPVHGSTTKMNFWVNVKDNTWYCFRHSSGGGALDWLAVSEGIIDCSEAGKLRGEKFKQALEIAKRRGLINE